MKKNLKSKAIILTRKNIGEADRLLTVFTENFGKIKIIARGSRKIKSKLAAHIEPLNEVSLEFIEGKSFYILTGAESDGLADGSLDNLDSYRTKSYLCELIELAYQEGEPDKTMFNILTNILKSDINNGQQALMCHYFELRLLSRLGFQPDLFHCKKCNKTLVEAPKYIGNFEGVYCQACSDHGITLSKNLLKLLRYMTNEPLENILKVKGTNNLNPELEKIISTYLYDNLPRRPRSLDL